MVKTPRVAELASLTKSLKLDWMRGRYTSSDEGLQALAKTTKYDDSTANGLTAWICDYVKFIGGKASRVNSTGTYSAKLGKFIKSGSTKGASDIDIVFRGRAIKVEVKIGRDRQSDKQKEYEAGIIAAGGLYFTARDFPSFYDWFKLHTEQ